MTTYSAVCISTLRPGKVWVGSVEADTDDLSDVMRRARQHCALDWWLTEEDIVFAVMYEGQPFYREHGVVCRFPENPHKY